MHLRLHEPSDDPVSDPQLIEAVRREDLPAVRARLANGASPDSMDDEQVSVLILAAETGDPEIFLALLDSGADPYFECRPGHTALDEALASENDNIVNIWIDRGLNVNPYRTTYGGPLHRAVTSGREELVVALLEAGADVNALDWQRRTPLSYATGRGSRRIAAILKEAGGIVDPDDPVHFGSDQSPYRSADLRKLAEQNAFSVTLEMLRTEYGWTCTEFDEFPGVYEVQSSVQLPARFEEAKQQILDRGFLFIESKTYEHPIRKLQLLFPTRDKYLVLETLETNGENYGLTTYEVIAWLQNVERRYPFAILAAGLDYVEMQFTQEIDDAFPLADLMYQVCPDIVEQGSGSVERLAEQIELTRRACLWWD